MFNKARITQEFAGLVGFRKGNGSTPIDAHLLESISGLYVNDISLVQLNLISQIIGSDESSISDYLKNVYSSEVLELLQSFIIFQKQKLFTKELLSNFDIGAKPQANNIRLKLIPNNRFVGIEIQPWRGNSINVSISALGLMFDGAVTDLPIYFYNSSQLNPVAVFNVTTTKAGSLEWIKTAQLDQGSGSGSGAEEAKVQFDEFVAEFVSQNYATGARSFIGYYEADIVAQGVSAIDTTLAYGCVTCGSNSSNAMMDVKSYTKVMPFQFESGNCYISRELPDLQNIGWTNETFGISLKLNVKCDVTEVLVANKTIFASSIQKQVAKRILWDIVNSNELSGDIVVSSGKARLGHDKLVLELAEEMKALSIDFRQIDNACLPDRRNALRLMNM